MKYIKTFEDKNIISKEERELNNLAKRIEYNINKYFNLDKKTFFKYIIYVHPSFNKIGKYWTYKTDYDIAIYTTSFITDDINIKEKINKFKQYIKDKKIKIASSHEYQMSIDQAKNLLQEIKIGFIYKDIEKYNL